MPTRLRRRHTQPSPQGTEFQRLSEGLRTSTLTEVLGVSREMVSRYRYQGAPPEKTTALRNYLAERAQGMSVTP